MRKEYSFLFMLLFAALTVFSQNKTINGKVTDIRDGSPLAGVTVTVKYSRVGSAYGAADAPVMLISSAEVNFIIAEIKLRAGDAAGSKTAYDKAVTEDMKFLGIPAATITVYLAQSTVAFDGTLQRIMEQKYITMFQVPYESWTDWRRTGFPVLIPALNNKTVNVIPRKFPHPQSEINVNSAQLQKGPGLPVKDETVKQKVWWDQ